MSSDASTPSGASGWTAKLNLETCSLCEVCVRHCPTGAMRNEKDDKTLALYFDPALCDNCGGEPACVKLCPETAIEIVPEGEAPAVSADQALMKGVLQACANCGDTFAPTRKLRSAGARGAENVERFKDYCPLCRRTDLVVKFIDERRMPGGKAQYRHGKQLMKRAGARSGRKTDPPDRPPS